MYCSISTWFCLLLSLLGVIRAQNAQVFNTADLMALASLDRDGASGIRPHETFRQFKKSFVRPCVYSMGNCITTTQQERLLKHMRSLVALREQP